jgi:cell division septal protein FtsQ
MKKNKEDLIDVIHSLKIKLGSVQLHEKLKELDRSYLHLDEERHKEAIFKHVCSSIGVSVQEVKNSKKNNSNPKIQQSISFISVLLQQQLGITQETIAFIFGLDKSNICKRISYVKKLDKECKIDKQVIEIYDTVLDKLKKDGY